MTKPENIKNSILIFFVIVVAHFQLVFKIFYTKWDNLSAFFPYRYTANHFWRSGHLPLWDPYQNLGYPMHANPQGYVWYPITQIFSLFGEYSPYFMNLESVLHICLAAIGVYHLFKYLNLNSTASIIGALSFGLSGFVTGSSHMIGFTIAAAWLPWILLYFHKCLHSLQPLNFILLGILFMLQVTGSYVAFSIVLVYILLGLLIYQILFIKINQIYMKLVKLSVLTVPVFLLLTAPFLFSIFDSLPYFSRASALSYDLNNFSRNFSFECLQSLFFPYINSSITGFKDVDVSLSNIYVGILVVLASFGFIFKKNIPHKTIIISALFFFGLLGLGVHTPVHKIVFDTIPGINLFRHPYLFHLYSTLILIYMGSEFLSYIISKKPERVKTIILIGTMTLILVAVFSLFGSDLDKFPRYIESQLNLQEKTPLNKYSHIIIQAVLVVLVYIIIFKMKTCFKNRMLLITIFEIIIITQLSATLNMFYNVPTLKIDNHLEKISNYSLTNQSASISLNEICNSTIENTAGLWVNLNTFQRTTGIDGYNPFVFKTLASLSSKTIQDSIGSYGLVKSKQMISNLEITYNGFSFDLNERPTSPIQISQNFHHNWTCEIDGVRVNISPNKYGLIEIPASKSLGRVRLRYDSLILRYLYVLSIVTMILLVGYILWVGFITRR